MPHVTSEAETMPTPATPPLSSKRRRLTQKPAAFALAGLMLAVPLVPMILDAALDERSWEAADGPVDDVVAISADGNEVTVQIPEGWEGQDQGPAVVLRNDGELVLIEVFDLEGRDPGGVAERLARLHRMQGIASGFDGGAVATSDGSLSGDTCVAVTDGATGTCAFLHDDDVIVSVVSLGGTDQPAAPLQDVVELIGRGQQ